MASLAEDAAVVGGLAQAFSFPWLALGLLVTVSIALAAAVWWVWRSLSRGMRSLLQPPPIRRGPAS